jgi:cytochrome P450
MVANRVELQSRHPEQRDALVTDPELITDAVEEVLRFHNSTQYMHRTLTCDIERHGRTMRAGDSVVLLIGAANHDDREYGPTAEAFDITRRPDRHLSFGYGAHFCLGAALARMEGKVALEQIHRRLPDYDVDHDAKIRFHSSNVTGWTSLPITFTPSV